MKVKELIWLLSRESEDLDVRVKTEDSPHEDPQNISTISRFVRTDESDCTVIETYIKIWCHK